jgi:hypothetical protein
MTPTEKKAFSRRPFEYISADLAYKLLKGDSLQEKSANRPGLQITERETTKK